MKWDPDSVKKDWLIADGEYDFEVIESEDQNDQWEGKPQLFVKFRVFLDNGGTVIISQFIKQAAAFLVDQLARSVGGLDDQADAGEVLAEDLLNKSGRGFIGRRTLKSGNVRNEFKRFLAPADDKEKNLQKDIKKAEKEDDIPF